VANSLERQSAQTHVAVAGRLSFGEAGEERDEEHTHYMTRGPKRQIAQIIAERLVRSS
jgi:hypothetical protein